MNKPKVSVLCLTYNQENYIGECLDSILSQKTDFDFEILINDDASTDNTVKIIDSYKKKNPGIIRAFYQKKNQFSQGIRGILIKNLLPNVKGEYIAICEGDDYFIDNNKLQRQVDFLEKNKDYTVCFHPVKITFENKEESKIFPEENNPNKFNLERLLKNNYIQTNSVMYRTIEYKDISSNSFMPADWYLSIFHAKKGKIGFLKEIMSVYRKHGNNMWNNSPSTRIVFYEKNGKLHLKMFFETIKLFQNEPSYKEIIYNNIAKMSIEMIKLDKKLSFDVLEVIHEYKDYFSDVVLAINSYNYENNVQKENIPTNKKYSRVIEKIRNKKR